MLENIESSIKQTELKFLQPKNIKEINTVDKIHDWTERNKQSLITPKMSELSLQKRYAHYSSDASSHAQPSTSEAVTKRVDNMSNVSTLSTNESLNDSFHTAASSDDEMRPEPMPSRAAPPRTPSNHFKRALREER